ncbi:MAG: TetR/AcrR family transcriptional regulator [Chitinispirillaceae bacterium]
MDTRFQRKQAVTTLKQNLILDAALKVIARDGYINAKLEDIAEEAGFAKASLYHYFPDKESIVLKLILREQASVIDQCDVIVSRESPFSEKLKSIMMIFFHKLRSHAQVANALGVATPSGLSNFAGMVAKHSELFESVQKNKDEVTGRIRELIQSAVESEILDAPLDVNSICIYVMAAVHSMFMEAYQYGVENYDFEEAVEKFFIFLSPWIKEETDVSPAGGQHEQ